MTRPSIVNEPGHEYLPFRLISPSVTIDDDVINLNVEPGAYCPAMARPTSGSLALARVSFG